MFSFCCSYIKRVCTVVIIIVIRGIFHGNDDNWKRTFCWWKSLNWSDIIRQTVRKLPTKTTIKISHSFLTGFLLGIKGNMLSRILNFRIRFTFGECCQFIMLHNFIVVWIDIVVIAITVFLLFILMFLLLLYILNAQFEL